MDCDLRITSCVRLRLQLLAKFYPNDQPVELLIYDYSLKHTMRETKGLGEDIHFQLGLSGDTTEKTHGRRDEKVSIETLSRTTLACVGPVVTQRTAHVDRTF